MQTAGNGVSAAAELAARVEHGQNDLDRRLSLGTVHVHGNSAAVVDDANGAVFEDCDGDRVAVPRERFVDGVVDDLVDEVMQAALTG